MSRSATLLIGSSSTFLLTSPSVVTRVPELDTALLAGRRRHDVFELDDGVLEREVHRRGLGRSDGDGLFLFDVTDADDADVDGPVGTPRIV